MIRSVIKGQKMTDEKRTRRRRTGLPVGINEIRAAGAVVVDLLRKADENII